MSSGSPGRGSVYRGAAIAVALTWVLRAIGLVSVFILARLLTPSDFGVVGLAMTAVALVETFSYLGMKQALLRMEKPERDYYDTAFTIQLIMFSALGLLLFAIAGPAADFFREPRVEPVIYALSLRFVMLGLVNIGVVEFERDFAFGRDLKMKATARIVSFFVTVALALWLRSYWALVVGMIVQSLVLTVLSYTMQPYRPRLSLARRRTAGRVPVDLRRRGCANSIQPGRTDRGRQDCRHRHRRCLFGQQGRIEHPHAGNRDGAEPRDLRDHGSQRSLRHAG